jgi:hypothetical protein
MVDAIVSKCNQILINSRTTPPSGTIVAVKFELDSKDRIVRILDAGSTSSEPGEQCCITAVVMTAPFGGWTDEMVATLGTSQELTARFYY